MNGGQINLKCSDFLTNVFSSFNTLHGSELFTDVTLVSDDKKQIEAHKIILSAGSEYFRDTLSDKSHPHPMLCLDGVSHEDLARIIKYLYVGEVSVPQSSLQKFLRIANKFKCFGLNEEEPQVSETEEIEEKHAQTDISIITDKEEVADSWEDSGPLTEQEVVEINDFYKENHKPVLIKTEPEERACKQELDEEQIQQPNTKFQIPADESSTYIGESGRRHTENEDDEPKITNQASGFIREKKFKIQQYLQSLQTPKYSKSFPELCRIDGKTISRVQLIKYLKEHYRSEIFKGTEGQIHHCYHCERSTRNNGHMLEHVQKHMHNLEFDCDICGKIVSGTQQLRAHKRKHKVIDTYENVALDDEEQNNINLQIDEKQTDDLRTCADEVKAISPIEVMDNRDFSNSPVQVQVRKIIKPQTAEPTAVKVNLLKVNQLIDSDRTPVPTQQTTEQLTTSPIRPDLVTPSTTIDGITWDNQYFTTSIVPNSENWKDFFILDKTDGKILCEVCNIHFKTWSIAKGHFKTAHLGIRFPCTYCDYKATTTHSLKLHIQAKHLNEKAQCSYCGKQIATSYIKTHIRSEHEHSLKILKCDQCTYESTRPETLKEHIEVRHENLMHKCSQCDYKTKGRKQIRNI